MSDLAEENRVLRERIAQLSDISERVRLERTLVESEQALRLAVDATRIGLWRWDVTTDRIHWDARTLQIFGVTEPPTGYPEYLGMLHPDDRERVERLVTESVGAGANVTFEHRIVRPPGEPERWAVCVISVTCDASGKVAQLLGGVLDISEQKRFEAQLHRAERVEALGQLTAGIAHNFNNLLAAIVPNLEVVIASSPEHREPLGTALDAALQARDLIRSLMNLSGRRPTQPVAWCAPAQLVRRVESICRLTFPREIELVTALETEQCVAMQPADLEQVLLNLLFNARDAVLARGDAERRIEIVLDRVAATREVRIRVRDSGTGMTEAVRSRIFEPFFTTKPPHEGSGLGLSTALERVREAGGTLECESAPGSGTVFTLRLAERAPPAEMAMPPAETVERSRGGEVILIVDDESLVRTAVNRLLATQDYEVVEAASAADARAVLERDGARIDLVILDQSMPMESGIEALASLRERSKAPVILFTGLARTVPPGVAAVIEKPAQPGELFKVVREVLDRRTP